MKFKRPASTFRMWFILLLLLGACDRSTDDTESTAMQGSMSEIAMSEEITYLTMDEEARVADLIVSISSAYSTNIFLNPEFGMAGQPSEEVIAGANLFIDMTVSNHFDKATTLTQRFGIWDGAANQYIWAEFADMTDQANRADVTYHLDKEFYRENLAVGAGESKAIQLFVELPARAYPVYLGLFGPDGGPPLETMEIIPDEECYVISQQAAELLVAERFAGSSIVAKELFGYQFAGEAEGGFYYPFEVTTDGETVYYFVKRDTGVIYSGTFDQIYADYPAVPGEMID